MPKKNLITLYLFVFLFFPISAFALGWHLQYQDSTQRTLYSVKFVDTMNGWVVGDSGVILHTSNGGNDWNHQTSGTLHALRGVSFTDTNHGCAVGDSGIILHTTNGGSDWGMQTSGTTQTLRSVSFVDPLHGWAVGDSGTIFSTGNGGTTWSTQTSETEYALNSVCFVDSSHGWAVGGYFVAPDTTNTHSVIVHTTNGGITWNTQNSITNYPLNGVAFTDSIHGWAVGGYMFSTIWSNYREVSLNTTNGGISWSNQENASGWPLFSVVFIDTNYGWSAGSSEYVESTRDGGINWRWDTQIGNVRSFLSISVTDSTHGWVVGDSGLINNYTGFDGVKKELTTILPTQDELLPNFPNPFNNSTTISYRLSSSERVALKVFDLSGREAAVLIHEKQVPGDYRVSFNAHQLPSGIYFYRLSVGSQTITRKMILLK